MVNDTWQQTHTAPDFSLYDQETTSTLPEKQATNIKANGYK